MSIQKKNNKKSFSNKGKVKPVYKKKPKIIIGNELAKSKNLVKEDEIKLVDPSEKCRTIIDDIKSKGFFVDARNGLKVFEKDIKEYHVDIKKDIPIALVEIIKPSKFNRGGTVRFKYVYRIIRYNSNEIVGIHSNNTNIYQMKTLKI